MENNKVNAISFLNSIADAYIAIGGHFKDDVEVLVTDTSYAYLCKGLHIIGGVDINENEVKLIYRGFNFKIKPNVPSSHQ